MPRISLNDEAINLLNNYNWPGNIRELKNFTEKISIIEEKRLLTEKDIEQYLPTQENSLIRGNMKNSQFSEREILYKVLFEMRNDINNLKEMLNSFSKNKEYEATIIDPIDQTENNLTENKQLREIEISNLNNQINSNIVTRSSFPNQLKKIYL